MGIDTTELLRVIEAAKDGCARLGIALDTEIICARYNAHCESEGLEYSYDIREMQTTLADLVRLADPSGPLDGSISYVNGEIFKVAIVARGPRLS
ncbi:hypothetical protein [Pseudomonas aegrilactucae]|uniref:Uncharacterized protein n=1 Tax=Pseudomonas aegrilactucae TaxID=2854028 RepID=A0A9Q3AH97_9PSED|nr:hypothetical protein [Pseudomonas aegrilactucae]MBV6290180.1 hypothetical protein [Pseudomonas aegrilactucae]